MHSNQNNQQYTAEDTKMDEALLEHYDDNFDHANYQTVLQRMRENGYEPGGVAAPLPNSRYYRG